MRYALDPAMPVLLRPDGAVQIGWDPHRAVLVCPPTGLTPGGLYALLRAMAAPMALDRVRRLAVTYGLTDADRFSSLLAELVAAGVLRPDADDTRPAGRALSIRVHGDVPAVGAAGRWAALLGRAGGPNGARQRRQPERGGPGGVGRRAGR